MLFGSSIPLCNNERFKEATAPDEDSDVDSAVDIKDRFRYFTNVTKKENRVLDVLS